MLLIILIIALKTGPLKKENNKIDITRQGKEIRKLISIHSITLLIYSTLLFLHWFWLIDYTEDNANASNNETPGYNGVIIRGLEDRLRELDRQ